MEWISIKDRLAKKGEKIGYVFDGTFIRYDTHYSESNGIWEYETAYRYLEQIDISHWMPLPMPPKD